MRFLGDLVLNLWDCGGQDAFYESYFERDRETIFRGVELLIYVFDIESETPEKDFDHFCGVLEAIEENSPDARIFLLIHKMDLVAEEDREAILEDRKQLIGESCLSCNVTNFQCFGTSIWDETLYKAWSEIVTNLIPNIRLLESHLNKFCKVCDADEVVLFERATFLVISQAQSGLQLDSDGLLEDGGKHSQGGAMSTPPSSLADHVCSESNVPDRIVLSPARISAVDGIISEDNGSELMAVSLDAVTTASSAGGLATTNSAINDMDSGKVPLSNVTDRHNSRTPHFDAHRFEKISNIIKQFKLSCGKAQNQFQGMQVQNSRFTAYIDQFTVNTYIMVIVSNPCVHSTATLWNIQNARNDFERFIPRI